MAPTQTAERQRHNRRQRATTDLNPPLPPPPEGRERRSISAAEVLERASRATEGIKIGRTKVYNPSLCKRAIELGYAGKSWAAIAREFGVSRKTINEWEAQYPAFSDALHRARAAAQAFWEDDVEESRHDKHYQAQAVKMRMGAQFEDYREVNAGRVDITLDLGGAIAEIEARRRPSDAKPVEVASSFAPLAELGKPKE